MNEILFDILDRLQGGLDRVSPRISWLDRLGGSWDERLMRVGIRSARDLAWSFAVHLSEAASSQDREIRERDDDTVWLGNLIARRWSPMHLAGRAIAAAESRSVSDIVAALSVSDVDFDAVARRADTEPSSPPTSTSLRAVIGRRR